MELTTEHIRLRSVAGGVTECVQVDVPSANGAWRTLAGDGVMARKTIWSEERALLSASPEMEWRQERDEIRRYEGGYRSFEISPDGSLICSTQVGNHIVETSVTPTGPGHITVCVTAKLDRASDGVELGALMSHFFLLPDGRAERTTEPLDFAWLPNLHWSEDGLCADHFFRSPATIACCDGDYLALVPDLDLFAEHSSLPHALDMRSSQSGTRGAWPIEAPRLSYGIATYEVEKHVYTRHNHEQLISVDQDEIVYGFDLFLGQNTPADVVAEQIAAYLWKRYGNRYFQDVRPQVLPFEEYGRKYTYVHELPRSTRTTKIGDTTCVGINNTTRRGANFHAWENDLHVAFGIKHYGEKWGDESLQQTADSILDLSLHAPESDGAFPCVYNFEDERYEGTLFWTARAADFLDGYDTAAMGVTAWWRLYWHEHFGGRDDVLESVIRYAKFLTSRQLPSGAIPTYFLADLTPAKQLLESATTAISGAVLAKIATLSGDKMIQAAALNAGRFVTEEVVPTLSFDDFEAYYSCSPKPLHAIDYWAGIRPHCNLSLQWACDQMLALHKLTGDETWLRTGEYLLSILSLYQQVWDPAHRSGHLYGGFGVMNTDGEWNDGRQARFVSTYADYYQSTRNVEYLERAVAACRSTFALMEMSENRENEINRLVFGENMILGAAAQGSAEPGQGYGGENIHHSGADDHRSGWTGMNWSSGGGLASSAYLERLFGSVWVEWESESAIPIDGLVAEVDMTQDHRVALSLSSGLESLNAPYTESREVTVKFGGIPNGRYQVTVNEKDLGDRDARELRDGLTILVTGSDNK